MTETDWLAERFETNRIRLRAVAYRMLGSHAEAEDAVQETWLRLNRAGAEGVDNLGAWLTTVVARVCLNMLRSRNTRREEPIGVHIPDPLITRLDQPTPEDEALMADSVGLALHVVLDTLAPAERLAFVLHDMFDLPFDEIAPIVGRSPAMARQLASRARRRVRGAGTPDPDVGRQREVVDAFFAAAHHGDFDALVAVLDPDVVMRTDGGTARPEASAVLRGAAAVARRTLMTAQPSSTKHPVLLNGAAGVVITAGEKLIAVMGFTVSGGKIVEIDAIVDPERLRRLVKPEVTEVGHTLRVASNPLFMVYFRGPATLADAARSLSEHKLRVVESGDSLEVRWKPDAGPVFWVGLNAEPWVVVEAAEQAEAKGVPELANRDRRFEVPMDDLDAALDEYNTLFEIQTVLQDLTGGYIVTSWNGNVIPPES